MLGGGIFEQGTATAGQLMDAFPGNPTHHEFCLPLEGALVTAGHDKHFAWVSQVGGCKQHGTGLVSHGLPFATLAQAFKMGLQIGVI